MYLPKQLSNAEISKVLDRVINEIGASSMKDMGRVMSISSKELSGKADGKVIANLVREKLQ